MTAEAVFLVIGCHLLVGCVCLEQSPTPPIAPQWVVRVAVLRIFDLDEPLHQLGSPLGVTRSKFGVICQEDFLHQHCAIWKLASLAVIRGRPWGSICHVHLVPLGVDDCVRSEELVLIPVVGGLAGPVASISASRSIRVHEHGHTRISS